MGGRLQMDLACCRGLHARSPNPLLSTLLLPNAGAAEKPWALAVDYGAATALFFLTAEGSDGKHSKRRSAYAKPIRFTASASK